MLITDRSLSSIAMIEKVEFGDSDEWKKEFQEKITRKGPINFVVLFVNDSYKGLDMLENIEFEITEERELMKGYKEYEYLKEDLLAVKQTSMFKKTPEEEIKLDEYSEDEGKPEKENDEAELLRRLRRDGNEKAAIEWEEHIEQLKVNMKKLHFKEEKSPFIPKIKRTA